MVQNQDAEQLYRAVKTCHEKDPLPQFDVSHKFLKPHLREYQKQAIRWMIYREKAHNKEYLSIISSVLSGQSGKSLVTQSLTKAQNTEGSVKEPLSPNEGSHCPGLKGDSTMDTDCDLKIVEAEHEMDGVDDIQERLHPLYEKFTSKDGKHLYYNRYGG